MEPLLHCTVGPQHFASWEAHFTQRYAPFFFTDEVRQLLPPHIMQSTRAEMGEDFVDLALDARDAYAIYRVAPEAGWCALLDAAQVDSLAPQTRHALFCEQARLGRGQVYTLADAHHLCMDAPQIEERLTHWSFTTPKGICVLLDDTVWRTCSSALRERWLRWFVARENQEWLPGTITDQEWAEMPHGASIRQLAGTFAMRSGPNCFATALAALLPEHAGIAERWLHQGPFARALAQHGFHPHQIDASALETIPPGSVLVWHNEQGQMQHACYICARGLALNKNSQAWFTPRHIVPLQHIVADWREDNLDISMYTASLRSMNLS